MSADFVKVYSGFFEGSLRDTPPYARLLFLAMLSHADPDGVALGAPSFWAAYVGITVDEVKAALEILSSPDPESTTPDLEGRRIERWGEGANRWRIVNYRKYYEKSRNDDRAEYKRNWDREHAATRHKSGSKRENPTKPDKPDPENERKTKGKRKTPPSSPQGDAIPPEIFSCWGEWLRYRRERKLPVYKPATITRLVSWLSEQPDPAAVVEQSIRNSWQGLFELKSSPNSGLDLESIKAKLNAEVGN